MVDLSATVWRDFATDGVPASGPNLPVKSDIRKWGTYVEALVAGAQVGGAITFRTLAEANSHLQWGDFQTAWVVIDPVAANNGIYQKNGAPGLGYWLRLADLPYSFIKATGGGTPNAIAATSDMPIPPEDGRALITLPIVSTNTASPVVVSFNGGTALQVRTVSGADIPIGGLVGGTFVAGFKSGSTFQLVTDIASAAIQAGAEAAQSAAEAAQLAAEAAAASATGATPVADRTALAALDSSTMKTAVIYGENGRTGVFVWDGSNLSAKVTSDAGQGVYVPPSTDATGASGAWVRSDSRNVALVTWFGAKGDVVIKTVTLSIASGAAALTATGATFTAADVGKEIIVPGAGAAGANLLTTIASVTDATHVGLADSASTTLSAVSKLLFYGTDDTDAFNDALAYASAFGGTVRAPAADYLIHGTIAVNGNGTTLTGDGTISTRLWSFKTTNCFITVGNGLSENRILDLQIDRPPYVVATSGADGIQWALTGISDGHIRRVWVRHCYRGFALGPTALSWLADCRAEYNWYHGVHIVNNAAQAGAQWYTNNVYCGQNNGVGFCIQTSPSAPAGGMGTGNITRLLTFANTSFGFAALGSVASPVQAVRLSDSFLGQDNTDEIYLDTYADNNILSNIFIELAGTYTTGPTLATPASHIGSGVRITANNISVMVNNVISNGNSTHGIDTAATWTSIIGCRLTYSGNLGALIADGNKALMTGTFFLGNTGGNISVTANPRQFIASANTAPVFGGAIGAGQPVVITNNLTVDDKHTSIICAAGAAITLTLPAPASNAGRILYIKNVAGFTVVSASANVNPLNGGAAGTALLAASGPPAKWCILHCDGSAWNIMAAN